jgi:hypothetical protein
VRFQFIEAHREEFEVQVMCEVLDVSRSGFYTWRTRPASQREMADAVYMEQIKQFFEDSHQTYGYERIWHDLQVSGILCGKHRVRRLMRQQGLLAKQTKRYKRTTKANPDHQLALNLLPALKSLDGLQGLTRLPFLAISRVDMITHVDELSGLREINGGDGDGLLIGDSANLRNLDGLSNLESVKPNMFIVRNSQLSDCSGIVKLVDDQDDYEPGPGPGFSGIPDVEDQVGILDNASGCESVEAIIAGGNNPGDIFADSFETQ